jgi:hypothetical protein
MTTAQMGSCQGALLHHIPACSQGGQHKQRPVQRRDQQEHFCGHPGEPNVLRPRRTSSQAIVCCCQAPVVPHYLRTPTQATPLCGSLLPPSCTTTTCTGVICLPCACQACIGLPTDGHWTGMLPPRPCAWSLPPAGLRHDRPPLLPSAHGGTLLRCRWHGLEAEAKGQLPADPSRLL